MYCVYKCALFLSHLFMYAYLTVDFVTKCLSCDKVSFSLFLSLNFIFFIWFLSIRAGVKNVGVTDTLEQVLTHTYSSIYVLV